MDVTVLEIYSIFIWINMNVLVVCQGQPTMSAVSGVAENNPLTFTCVLPITTNPVVTWFKNNIHTGIYQKFISGQCVSDPSPLPQGFSFTCNSTTVYKLTILQVTRTQNGDKWQCRNNDASDVSLYSNSVTIEVQVPISSVSFINPAADNGVDVVENRTRTFTCQTSGGIPAASVTWYKISGSSETLITLGVTSSQNISADRTVVVTSSLTYTAMRVDHTSKVFCRANNTPVEVKQSTRQIELNILYPPLNGPVIQGVFGTEGYKMIRNSVTKQQLTCSVTGGNPLAQLSWNCYNGIQTESAQNTTTLSKTVSWTAGMNEDSVCRCTATHTSSSWSRDAAIAVTALYPPSVIQCTVGTATLTNGTIHVIQSKAFNISCHSAAKPIAQYSWTLPNGVTDTNPFLSVPNVQTGTTYILSVWNTMVPSIGNAVNGIASTAFNLNTLVPPSAPAFSYVTGARQTLITTSQLKEIQDTSFSLVCNATGNPQPTSSWSGGSNTWGITAVNNISNRCTARSTLTPTGYQSESKQTEAALDVIVLTPPGVITCSVGAAILTSGPLYVIRGSMFSVRCESTSYPSPYKYTWTLPDDTTVSGSTLVMQNIHSVNSNQYRIEVNNSMVPTVGTSRDGANSSRLNVYLLYPPAIQPKIHAQEIDISSVINDSYVAVVENDTFSVFYDIDHGNPNATTLGWTRTSTNSVIAITKVLSFNRIQRNAAGSYTFTASNEMMPTGYSKQKGEAMRTVYINVKYPAEIRSFFANNISDKTTIIANTGDDLRIMCTTDSNPISQMQLLLGGKSIKNDTLNGQLDFDKANTSCEYDMGEYICMAQNELNTVAVVRRLQYFVKCTPRWSPFVPTITNVSGRLHMPGAIPISVIAFPEPTFVWQKLNASTWQTIANTSRVYIVTSTNRLQSNITIVNVTPEDFGTYRAIVNNSEGGTTFELIYQSSAKPEPVTELDYQHHTLTTDSVVVTWTPGFDGGLQQIFYVLLKKTIDIDWLVMTTYEHNITLRNLKPGNKYMVKVYAKNPMGNSTESAPIAFTTQNNNGVSLRVSSPVAGIVGGAVGGALGLLAAIVIAVLVLRKYRLTCKCAFAVERKHTRTENPCNIYETPTNRLDITDHLYSGVQGLQTENDTAHDTVVYENTSLTPMAGQYELLGATGTTNRLGNADDPLRSTYSALGGLSSHIGSRK